jgi:large subunit ribosomal protein L19
MNNYIVSINQEKIIRNIEINYINTKFTNTMVGDTIKLGFIIIEGNKERIQYYEGIILSQRNSGLNKTITVRKIFRGIGIERTFMIYSPKLVYCEILKSSKVRKSKLYYLRYLYGKAIRLKQRFD